MVGRADEDHLVAEERLVGDGSVSRRGTDDAELELAARDLLDDRLRVRDGEVDGNLGIRLRELAEQDRHDRSARPRRRAERELTAERPVGASCDLVDQLPLECEHPLSAPVEAIARLGGLHAAAGTIEQLLPEALLERADLLADGRLGDAEPLSRLGEALALDDGAERRQLARVHK